MKTENNQEVMNFCIEKGFNSKNRETLLFLLEYSTIMMSLYKESGDVHTEGVLNDIANWFRSWRHKAKGKTDEKKEEKKDEKKPELLRKKAVVLKK
jgi:hypothetical protein